VEIFASASRSKSETPYRFGAQENTSYTWGIQGQWNIFDRFQTKNRARQAVANRRKAEYDLRQKRLDIELEVVQLHNNLVEALESHEVSSVTVEQSQEDLRLAAERFRVGAGTSLDVITAQVNLAQAKRDLVDAQVNILKLRNQLERAVGGSF
jgi:outer membrane protein TolC